jgi:hypothetical protein
MKFLPKFEDIEDAEDFLSLWFNRLLWGIVIGLSIIWISFLLGQSVEPDFWLAIEEIVGITW